VLQQVDGLAVPAIVLEEYHYGIRQSRNRARYERWLAGLIATCRVLAVDEGTADCYAEIRHELRHTGTPIPGNDLWIAALARQHGFAVLSRDHHFDHVAGLTRIAW
jgi:predicted nucleic acid-binding protein